jgi:hypothetical protein
MLGLLPEKIYVGSEIFKKCATLQLFSVRHHIKIYSLLLNFDNQNMKVDTN